MLWFQDDPFTAIDLPIGSHIFEDGILHFCLVKRKRTVILVTHELHFLPFAHAVCIHYALRGDNGTSVSNGSTLHLYSYCTVC